MKLLRQSIRTRGAFATPLQKLRALPSYLEILTVPMALRVIRIALTNLYLTHSIFRRISEPLDALTAGVARIRDGDLDAPIAYTSP